MGEPEKSYNASDEAAVSKAKQKAKRGREQELEDIKMLMSTVWGRRFAWRYLSRAGIFQSSFTGNSATYFKEGERNMGLILLTDINEACPEMYVKMLEENSTLG